MSRFSEDIKIVQAITITAGAAGATDIECDGVDMAGFDGVCAIVQFGAIVSGATTAVKLQQSADDDGDDDYTDIDGTVITVADDDDGSVVYVDCARVGKRYVRLVVERADENATCAAMYYLYQAARRPVTHGTGISGVRFHAPAEVSGE